MADRRRLRRIVDKLAAEYGRPVLRPHWAPVDELVLTVLSQNTNDRNRDVAYGRLRERFPSWDAVRHAPLEEIEEAGIPLDALASDVNIYLDPFDLICHVAFDQPPLTRRQRAANVRRKDVFTRYGQQARAVLEALLSKYEDEGIMELDDPRILQIRPFDGMGTPVQLIKQFGTRTDFERAVHELQSALYEGAA